MNNKNKIIILISIITGVLLVAFGLTYAAFTYNRTGETSELVLGDIYMHYGEKNQLILENAMPSSFKLNTLKLPSVVTGYKVNPVMKDQELNTLSRCIGGISVTGKVLDEGSTWESFCRGEGTADGMSFEEHLNSGDRNFWYNLSFNGLSELYVKEGEKYIPNPVMQTQEIHELSVCYTFIYLYPSEFGSLAGDDVVDYCQGNATIDGKNFQEYINDLEETDSIFIELLTKNLIVQDGEKNILNPKMQNQTYDALELSNCMYIYPKSFRIANQYHALLIENFCRGEGIDLNGRMLQDFIGNLESGPHPNFYMTKAIIEDELPEVEYSYTNLIVNPNMEGEVLESCKTIFTDLGYEFEEGKSVEDFCQGTGISSGKSINDLATDTDFLKGEGHQLLRSGVVLAKIENLPYFEFTISGKNTYSNKDIYYDVVLTHGDNHETRTERIRDDLLRFSLTEVDSKGNEIPLANNISLTDLKNGERVYVETIPKNTMEEINKTYRLYMNIANSTKICGGEVSKSCDYYIDADKSPNWNDVFASVKVNVTGDFNEKELPRYFADDFKEVVNAKVGTSITDDDGTIYLSGNNDMLNYNYVLYSGKIWRITSLYSDGTMKLVTEDAASESIWGSDDGKFINSSVYTYLNNDFLDTLDNYKNVIVTDYDWDVAEFVTSNEIADAEYVTAPLGLINSYEYSKSYQNITTCEGPDGYLGNCTGYQNGYLAVNYDWWILNNKTLQTSSTYSAYSFVRSSGSNASFELDNTNFQESNSIRPSIVLRPNVLVSGGDGSYDNPYVINTGNN